MQSFFPAVKDGNLRLVRRLLNEKNTIYTVDEDGWTALMWAAHCNHYTMVEELIRLGSNVHHRSTANKTPLMAAAMNSADRCVQLLLAAGADTSARDKWNNTALAWAESHVKFLSTMSGATCGPAAFNTVEYLKAAM